MSVATWLETRRRKELRKERDQAKQYLDGAQDSTGPAALPIPLRAVPHPSDEAVSAVRYKQATEDAEAEIRRHLPVNPRSAKRVLNQLRLALFIAEQRGVFTAHLIQRAHVAKWVVLTEQWPRLGETLTSNPSAIVLLEQAEDIDRLKDVLHELCPDVDATPELLDLLRTGTSIGLTLKWIIRFDGTRNGSAAVEAPEGGLGSE